MLKDFVVVANLFVRTLLLWPSYVEGLVVANLFVRTLLLWPSYVE
jgi:hypothetical protein